MGMTRSRTRSLRVAYSPGYLEWRLGAGHPTNPERAALAVASLAARVGTDLIVRQPRLDAGVWAALGDVHTGAYVDAVQRGWSGEWDGQRPDLGRAAALMFQGTRMLVGELLADHALGARGGVYFNPQGAKHHAMEARSGGFCVFNDMAWAGRRLMASGERVAYLDWDAHHGDGVEAMLLSSGVTTCSIHDGTIFPGTGRAGHLPEEGAYNWALRARADDRDLEASLEEALVVLGEAKPSVLMMAIGADGLDRDPLSSLTYTLEGLDQAAWLVKDWADDNNVTLLVGGAGGYQPHTETPEHWARAVEIFVS